MLICRKFISENFVINSKKGPYPEIFHNKNQVESNQAKKLPWKIRKSSHQEANLKDKLLRNEKEKIKEFDKEKHLIKSFILANRKQEREIDRDKSIIFDKSSMNSSMKSKRSYKMRSLPDSGNSMSMVPIEVS